MKLSTDNRGKKRSSPVDIDSVAAGSDEYAFRSSDDAYTSKAMLPSPLPTAFSLPPPPARVADLVVAPTRHAIPRMGKRGSVETGKATVAIPRDPSPGVNAENEASSRIRWSQEEEAALKNGMLIFLVKAYPSHCSKGVSDLLCAGVEKYGKGVWNTILDAYELLYCQIMNQAYVLCPCYRYPVLQNRTNVNLKDKWRNIEKIRTAT